MSTLARQIALPGLDAVEAAVERLSHSGIEERGAIFTKLEVVDFVLDLSGYTPEKPLHLQRLLEPSFGNGDFLIAAVTRLIESYRTHVPHTPLSVEAISNCVRGVELNGTNFAQTRERLAKLLEGEGLGPNERNALLRHWLTFSIGAGTCSQATAFLARVSVDSAHQTAYISLICSLVNNGIWSKLDILYLFATQGTSTALTNLTSSTYSAIATGSPTFTADQGFTTGTNKWVDTGLNLASSTNFTQDSAMFGVWNLTTSSSFVAAAQAATAFGGLNYLRPSDANCSGACASVAVNSSAATSSNPGTVSTGAGLDLAIRPDSTQLQIWQNTTQLVDFVRASVVPDNVDLETAGDNTNGNNTGAYQIASIFAGAALTAGDVSNFYSAMHTYMQSIAGVP